MVPYKRTKNRNDSEINNFDALKVLNSFTNLRLFIKR